VQNTEFREDSSDGMTKDMSYLELEHTVEDTQV
jgi:hypothetical protein